MQHSRGPVRHQEHDEHAGMNCGRTIVKKHACPLRPGPIGCSLELEFVYRALKYPVARESLKQPSIAPQISPFLSLDCCALRRR